MWNSNTNQPAGLEFEVMDMIYHLPFRDWMEVDSSTRPNVSTVAQADSEDEMSGDAGGASRKRARR